MTRSVATNEKLSSCEVVCSLCCQLKLNENKRGAPKLTWHPILVTSKIGPCCEIPLNGSSTCPSVCQRQRKTYFYFSGYPTFGVLTGKPKNNRVAILSSTKKKARATQLVFCAQDLPSELQIWKISSRQLCQEANAIIILGFATLGFPSKTQTIEEPKTSHPCVHLEPSNAPPQPNKKLKLFLSKAEKQHGVHLISDICRSHHLTIPALTQCQS